LPAIFPVHVMVDGGSAGGLQPDGRIFTCDFTYSVFDQQNRPLLMPPVKAGDKGTPMTKVMPQELRYLLIEYQKPDDYSLGFAYYDGDGKIQLWLAVQEIPKLGDCNDDTGTGDDGGGT
jgi:hypothetical protein